MGARTHEARKTCGLGLRDGAAAPRIARAPQGAVRCPLHRLHAAEEEVAVAEAHDLAAGELVDRDAGLRVDGARLEVHARSLDGRVDVEAVVATISKGAAQSWQMENRFKTMNEGKFDFGFAVDWMRKDLAICLGEARKNGARLPVAALVDQFYAEVQTMGGRRWDTSSLIARLEL